MHKVKFVIPRAISPENWASKDPKDYTADSAEGWMLELEPEPLIRIQEPQRRYERGCSL